MKISSMTVAVLAVSSIAGLASAQPGVMVSGISHSPVGNGQLGTAEGRRLPVHNLGSSGNDGVSIDVHGGLGVGASVECASLPVGAVVRHRYKGWDGTIKGRCDVTKMSGGWGRLTCAYPGALEVQCELQNTAGQVVASGVFPAGGIQAYLSNICPDGSTPSWSSVHHVGPPPTYVEYATWELRCSSAVVFNGNTYDACIIKVLPIFPAGSPPMEVASMVVTSTASDIVVRDAHISSDSWGIHNPATGTLVAAECSGLGQAQIGDVCDSPVGCTPAERRIRSSGIGSSGNDGIEVQWRVPCASVECDVSSIADASGALSGTQITTAAMSKGNWNQAKNVKCRTMPAPGGYGQIDFDVSELPGTQLTITATAGGVVTGGTSGDPAGQKIYLDYWWFVMHPFSNQGWQHDMVRFDGLGTNGQPAMVYLFNGTSFQAVMADSITVQLVGSDLPDAVESLKITGSNMPGGQLEVGNVVATEYVPRCPADFNGDGSIDFFDYLDFVDAFSSGVVAADFNKDGTIDFFDYLDFVDAFSIGC